jgi:hypothetical protein
LEHGAGGKEHGAGGKEHGAEGKEHGARGRGIEIPSWESLSREVSTEREVGGVFFKRKAEERRRGRGV